MREWTVYVVTDSGTKVPHWSARTRREARAEAKRTREGAKPFSVRVRVERDEYAEARPCVVEIGYGIGYCAGRCSGRPEHEISGVVHLAGCDL